MCNSLILGLVALEGGTVGKKGEGTWLAGSTGNGGGQCLLLASLRSIFLSFSTAATREKLTAILIITNSAFTLWGVFGEFLWH